MNPAAAEKLQFTTVMPEGMEIPPETVLALPPASVIEEDSGEDARNEQQEKEVRRERIAASQPPPRRPIGRPPKHAAPEKEEGAPPPPPKIRAPDFREWHEFTSTIVLKWICRGYIGWAFRGIEREQILNSAELKAIEPDLEMLHAASMPFAHFANKNKFLKKNGRAIIDSTTGIESVIALGMWMSTVNRIAKRHADQREPREKRKSNVVNINRAEPSGENVQSEAPAVAVRGFGNFGGSARVPGVGG